MSASRYTVRRVGWFQPPHGDPYTRRLPGAEPVAAFDTFDAAEAHRRELESAARDDENPFRFGGGSVFFQSSLDGPRLHDWLMDAGIEPPASELRHSDWREWWNAFAHTWSADQLAHAWAAFDKVRFFDVAEVESDPAGVVVEIAWGRLQRDWDAMTAGTEGGRLVRVYRRAKAAEADCARRNRVRARGYGSFRYDRRRGYDGDSNRTWPAAAATFFEALEVPSDVSPLAGAGFLVQRRAIADFAAGNGWRDRPPADARVPVALFADRAAAAAHRDRLTAECRQALNPFTFLDDSGVDGARDELERLGLPLPLPRALPTRNRCREWVEWWDLCQDEATDEQRAAVWALCDRPLFEVLRVEVSGE
ncbi:MAG: hypothetical protein J0I06_12405 [Planctomycetes bacterium]|nr:hypothetical protein [Planctomycetota bacterium]